MIDVLVVDDDFMVASIHTRFVERTEGYRVIDSVRTGHEALQVVAEQRPGLVLLDVHLPDISGLEVLRRLRAGGLTAEIIVITAAREADSVRSALHGGAAHYLVKPFEYEDLRVRLEQVRESRQALQATEVTDQGTIDALFGGVEPRPSTLPMPKGLSPETGELVLASLSQHAHLSAAECGEEVGMSRVTARRYLEHFVTTGVATVRLRYGRTGRPERRYSAA